YGVFFQSARVELQQFHLYFCAKPALKRFRRSLEAWRHFIHTGDQEDVGTNTCSSGEELLDLMVIQARRALCLAKVQATCHYRESVPLDVRAILPCPWIGFPQPHRRSKLKGVLCAVPKAPQRPDDGLDTLLAVRFHDEAVRPEMPVAGHRGRFSLLANLAL